MTTIRFTYNGVPTAVECEPIMYDIIAKAAIVAGWAVGTIVDAKTTGPATWIVSARGDIVTAEVVDE